MIANNPHAHLKKLGIAPSLLSAAGTRALFLFDKANKFHEDHPDNKSMQESAMAVAAHAVAQMNKEAGLIKKTNVDQVADTEKKEMLKIQSKKIAEKSNATIDHLTNCRKMLKEERKRKIAAGEIKAPKKKNLVMKLRSELGRMANLIPEKLKTNPKIVEKTRLAVLKFLTELKNLWGMDKIKPIEDEIKKQFEKLEQSAEK